jgi:sigma-E factor negative regulatory protein RseA
VAAIAWNVGGFGGAPAGAQLAQSFPAAPAAVVLAPAGVTAGELGGAVMMRDPRLDELLAAHRQFGGASALQNPSGFLRNATFEGPAR